MTLSPGQHFATSRNENQQYKKAIIYLCFPTGRTRFLEHSISHPLAVIHHITYHALYFWTFPNLTMKSPVALLLSSIFLLELASALPGPNPPTAVPTSTGAELERRAPPITFFLSDCSVFENGSVNSEIDYYSPGHAPSTPGADRGPDGRCDPQPQNGAGITWEGARRSCNLSPPGGAATAYIDSDAKTKPLQSQVGTLTASNRTYQCKVDNQRVIYTDKIGGKVVRTCRAMYYCQ